MKKLFYLIILLGLFGCEANIDPKSKERAILKNRIFMECMESASKITRQGDDDVSDIISECNTVAGYQSYSMI